MYLVSAAVVGAALDCIGARGDSCLPYVGATYLDGVVYLFIISLGCNSCAACFMYAGMSLMRVGFDLS